MTSDPAHVRSAPDAAAAAGITYRQLDYWERQGWIKASRVEDVSPGRRVRWYTPLDVARLAALRHLARSGFDVALIGPTIGRLELAPQRLLVVGGDPERVVLADADQVASVVTREGRWSVFDPRPLLTPDAGASDRPVAVPVRRTA